MFLPDPRIIGIELFLRTNVDVWEEDGAQVMVAATIARSGEEPPRGLIALDYRSADAETIAIGLAEVKALAQEKKVPRAKLCGTGRYIVDPKGDEKLGTLNMLGDGDPIPKGKAKACLEWFAVAYEHELKGKKIPKLLVSDDPFWMPWTADKRVAPGFRAKFQELLAHRRTRSI